jgi:hypothetical protein
MLCDFAKIVAQRRFVQSFEVGNPKQHSPMQNGEKGFDSHFIKQLALYFDKVFRLF